MEVARVMDALYVGYRTDCRSGRSLPFDGHRKWVFVP